MSSKKIFNIAIFVRDQKYYEQIEKYLQKTIAELNNISITFIAESEISTNYKFINLKEYTKKIQIDINENDFYKSLDSQIWKNKKVYKADPRYVGKTKELSWVDQYKLISSCRQIFKEEKFDLVFMGAASYLFWIVPHLVALEMNVLAYKLLFFDYINPFFKGIRVWFCTDPFWNIRTNSKYDFNWDDNKINTHVSSLRKSLIEDDFNLDATAVALKESFTPTKIRNIVKNLLKLFFRGDYLSKLRLIATRESIKNKKIYTDFNKLPNNFLLFPLNMPYDEQLLLRAPGFEDNYENIKYILDNLPKNSNLVIKEHPVNPGMLENKLIKNLLKNYSNIFFISPTVPLRDILSKSLGLITINSTAGLESLLINKNILALGMGYYKDLESVYKVDGVSIKKVLEQMISGKNIIINEEIELLLERILNQTFPEPNNFPDKKSEASRVMNEALHFKIKQITNFK